VVRLPKLGQSMEAATIVQWHVAEGGEVAEGQLLVSIETDKATYDLEAPAAGRLHIEVAAGEEVAVETVLARLLAAGETAASPNMPAAGTPAPAAASAAPARRHSPAGRVLASPKAKRLAAELGVDLGTLRASGEDGVISAEDVERAAGARAEAGGTATAAPVQRGRREIGRERLTGPRATMARRLQQAWQEIPHIVQMIDVDASGLLAARAAYKERGADVTVNDLLLVAAAKALLEAPDLNVSLEAGEVVQHEGVDVGFAVETERGLFVPVIRGADNLTAEELAAETARLSTAAREARLGLAEMGGASLTVSNLGMYGIKAGTPVINPGEPLLVFAGAIEDRPVAVRGDVVVRPTLTLSIAYDHRLASGAGAAAYTVALKREIESLAAGVTAPRSGAEPEHLGHRHVRSVSPGGDYRVDVSAPGGRRWTLDEPEAMGGTDQGATPVDAFLGALLGCMTISLKAAGRRRKVPIERVEGEVRANPERVINEITLVLDVWSAADEEQVRGLLPVAERGCWVSRVVNPEIAYTIEMRVHG